MGANGRGLSEALGVENEVDILLGTFSKSLAAIGGFAAGKSSSMEVLRYASRPYIFTASPSPSAIASVRSTLHSIATRPELRDQLWSNANRLYEGLAKLGYSLGPQVSPIVPVMVGTKEQGLQFWHALIRRGIYVNLVLPPATPAGMTLVRCSVSAAHSPAQIDQIIDAFAMLRFLAGLVN